MCERPQDISSIARGKNDQFGGGTSFFSPESHIYILAHWTPTMDKTKGKESSILSTHSTKQVLIRTRTNIQSIYKKAHFLELHFNFSPSLIYFKALCFCPSLLVKNGKWDQTSTQCNKDMIKLSYQPINHCKVRSLDAWQYSDDSPIYSEQIVNI